MLKWFRMKGPIAKRTAALRAYTALKQVCPRLSDAGKDIADYSLHMGLPEDLGLYGEVARKFDAREFLVVTIRIGSRPRTIPATLIPTSRFDNIPLISSDRFTGVLLTSPLAMWLCNTSSSSGDRMAILPNASIGVETR